MESAKNSGQVEGWNQILDKVAAVVAGLAQAKPLPRQAAL